MTAAEHLAVETEGAGSPALRPIEQFVEPAVLAQWDRDRERRHEGWLRSLREKKVFEAAQQVSALGNALVLWVDVNGELQARRISREASVLREFVPGWMRRSS